jgi:hypothetical protein
METMMERQAISTQLKNNIIALLSLAIALFTLTYMAWREEVTEKNRNLRVAAFEVLKNLGQLQVIVNYSHYDPTNSMGNPMLGWGYISLITDLSELLPPPIPEKVENLFEVWQSNWSSIKTDQKSTDLISQNIDDSRTAVLEVLNTLK